MHNDIPFTLDEINFFKAKIDEVKSSMPGELRDVIGTMNDVRFFWRKDMEVNDRDGRLQFWNMCAYFDLRYRRAEQSKMLILPTLGHELCHLYFYDKYNPIRFYLTNLPYIRDISQHKLCWAVEKFIVEHFELPDRCYV
jgi:hypothetical protein